MAGHPVGATSLPDCSLPDRQSSDGNWVVIPIEGSAILVDLPSTMRRSPLARAAATLLSLLFLLAWGEPVALHPCPMHDGLPAAATGRAGELGGPAAGGHAEHGSITAAAATGHAGHDGQGERLDAATPAPEGPSHDDGAHPCQCLGHCCSAAGVVLAPMQAVRWQGVIARLAEPPVPEAAATTLVTTPHVLPFANGPPRLA